MKFPAIRWVLNIDSAVVHQRYRRLRRYPSISLNFSHRNRYCSFETYNDNIFLLPRHWPWRRRRRVQKCLGRWRVLTSFAYAGQTHLVICQTSLTLPHHCHHRSAASAALHQTVQAVHFRDRDLNIASSTALLEEFFLLSRSSTLKANLKMDDSASVVSTVSTSAKFPPGGKF